MPRENKGTLFFGLDRRTFNLLTLAFAAVIIVAWLWKLIRHTGPTAFLLADAAGALSMIFGVWLYLTYRLLPGIILVALSVAEGVVVRIAYSMSPLSSVGLWIFAVVLVVFIVLFLQPPRGRL